MQKLLFQVKNGKNSTKKMIFAIFFYFRVVLCLFYSPVLKIHVTHIIYNRNESSTQFIFKVTAILIFDIFGQKWKKITKNTFLTLNNS
jgi:hypothetical protein